MRHLALEFGEIFVTVVNLNFKPSADAISQETETRSKVFAHGAHDIQLLFFE